MFGEFGNSSQRHRVPRDHSPFGHRSHHPMFPSHGEWDEDPFRHTPSPNFPKGSECMNSHVERIIPIQIVGSSTPNQQQQHTAPTPEHQKTPVKEQPKQTTGEPEDKKYASHRHNTTEENLQVKHPEGDKQRAKSEPPLKWTPNVNGTATAQPTSQPSATTCPPPPQPQPQPNSPAAGVTQLGGCPSKNTKQETGNGGFRNIPIFVEGRGGPAGGARRTQGPAPPQPQPSPTQNAQKTRFQPEPSTTPPPPPKKVTKDTLQIIQEIVDDVRDLEAKVNALPHTPKTAKEYLYLDEMLTRDLIKLDTIETEGKEDIRMARKECIKLIQKVVSILEGKAETQEEGQGDSQALVPISNKDSQPNDPPQEIPNAVDSAAKLTPSVDMENQNVTTPVATAEAAMDISPTMENPITLNHNNNTVADEAMAIEEKEATA